MPVTLLKVPMVTSLHSEINYKKIHKTSQTTPAALPSILLLICTFQTIIVLPIYRKNVSVTTILASHLGLMTKIVILESKKRAH